MKNRTTLALSTTLIMATSAMAAPALAAPMEIEDLAKVRNAGSLVVAPDGQTVAFTVSKQPDLHAGEEDGPSKAGLYLLRPGSGPVAFASGENSVSRPHFSPDGGTLYFLTKRGEDEHNALYSIPLSGGEAVRVFGHDTAIGDYAVSPDGGTLYFVATEKSEDDDGLKDKGFDAYAYEEDLDMAALWTVRLGADEPEAAKRFDDKHVTGLELSPDGRTLVVSAVPTALIDDFYMKSRLHVLDAATGRLRAEVRTPGKLGGFKISPDGARIAFTAGTDIGDTSDGVLMVADAASGAFRQLTADAPQHIMDVEWADSDTILANAHRGVESALVAYDLSGREERTVATPEDIVVRDVEVGGGGRLFLIADSPAHPREVFSAQGGAVRKLTDLNGWLEDIDLAPQRAFSFTARDDARSKVC
ncbi:MAG: LpqB family beta-propeller domain-containing protein [Pseudomonadota bacterium]